MAHDLLPTVCEAPRSVQADTAHVGVMYSGLRDGALVMGDAVVIPVDKGQLRLKGDQLVRVGMYLTLLIFLPGAEEPVAMAESRVAAVGSFHFDVDLLSTSLLSVAELEQQLRELRDRSFPLAKIG